VQDKEHVRGIFFEETIMKKIDVKSCVIGLLLGVCVMLVVGAGGEKSSEVGRYRISLSGESPSSCWVIDSATGRLWRIQSSTYSRSYGSPDEWDKKAEK